MAFVRKGDFRAAELIYREKAGRLPSADRKQEITAIYLEFANAYFTSKDEIQHKPDYHLSVATKEPLVDLCLAALDVVFHQFDA
ncbi:MAG: hypothetical protein IT427_02280 [Pirellulales bacterium]|nr:hypothetical protein [Pirellulales bacterium]